MTAPASAFGGVLVRRGDAWAWRDGELEPRVRDLRASEAFQFPRVRAVRHAGGVSEEFVAVPREAVVDDPDLFAPVFRQAGEAVAENGGCFEVPADIWDAWASAEVIGLAWDPADEPAILARAEALGARIG